MFDEYRMPNYNIHVNSICSWLVILMTDIRIIAGYFKNAQLIMKNALKAGAVFASCPIRLAAPEGMLQTGLLSEYAACGASGTFALVRDCECGIREGDCAILLPPGTGTEELRADLDELFSHEAKLSHEKELLRSAGLLGSMSEVVSAVSAVVGSECALYDSLGRLIAFSGRSFSGENIPPEALGGMRPVALEGAGLCTAAACRDGVFTDFCLHIELDGEPVGYLLFFGEFTPYDRPFCEFLPVIADVVKSAMRRMERVLPGQKFSTELFLMQLIGGEKMSRAALSSRAELCGLETSGYFALLLVDLSRHPLERPRMIPVVNTIERVSGANPILSGSIMTLLFSLETPEELQRRVELAWEHVRNLGYQGVYSRVFTELEATGTTYTRVLRALELLSREDSSGRLASFDELELGYVVSLCGMTRPEDLHPSVVTLLLLDEKGKFDHTGTLYEYLINAQNLIKTCDALGIHRNTLDYRLRRIAESTGLDFSDGKQMFSVLLSLSAARQMKKQRNTEAFR